MLYLIVPLVKSSENEYSHTDFTQVDAITLAAIYAYTHFLESIFRSKY